MRAGDRGASVVDLLGSAGTGPVWGMAGEDLNATLLVWPAGHEVGEHTNAELDVVVVVLAGSGSAVVDGHRHELAPGSLPAISKGAARSIAAGPDGLRYLSVHKRRGPLQIG